mmetsp:Transcript_19883/g.17570  ORF Transcript_19883/g.17570 Transcript_19883/m.17570 type:complete len:108 (+) Transcript_19883:136-459(+)
MSIKLNFSNFIEAIIRLGEHTCPTDQKLNNIIIGFVESRLKDTKKSLAFSYKFYIYENEICKIIQKYTPTLTKIYQKELETRLINTEDDNNEQYTVMNFRIIIALLK